MIKELSGNERRKLILSMMRESKAPLSGTTLGKRTGVSRQVVVQDIALLRMEGYEILATAKGYLLEANETIQRVLKVCHSDNQVEEELQTIVDLGGSVMDVAVNHRVYGKVVAPLHIRSRRDISVFMENLRSGKSVPLSNVTSGYHFHRISAGSQEVLDEIEAELKAKGFLAEVMPYEEESMN